jgi:hypothetical protein
MVSLNEHKKCPDRARPSRKPSERVHWVVVYHSNGMADEGLRHNRSGLGPARMRARSPHIRLRLLLIRLAGRRVFGRWSALDIIVSIIVGSNLSRALTGSAPLFGTIVATTLLMLLHWVLAHLAARSRSVSRILEGTPIALSQEGRLRNMHNAGTPSRRPISTRPFGNPALRI